MLPATLPNEVWGMVISNLRKAEIKSFSRTSRQYRALALPKLFESVSFYFGTYFLTGAEFDEKDIARIRRTQKVIRKVIEPDHRELDFTQMVREVKIVIVAGPYITENTETMELVLQKFSNMQRFIWFGPYIPLFDVLSQNEQCAAFLHTYNLDGEYADTLSLLNNIKLFETVNEWSPFSAGHTGTNSEKIFLEGIAENRWDGLESLSLNSPCAQELCRGLFNEPMQNLARNLTHFAIEYSSDCSALRAILHQARALESLALVEAETLSLPLDKDALTSLRNLKISIQRTIDPESPYPDMSSEARKIKDFLLRHKNLHRFAFSQYITWITDEEPAEDLIGNLQWFSDILDAVCSLEALTALGLTFPALSVPDTRHALQKVTTYDALLKTCKAIRLGGVTSVPLWDCTFAFTNCTFIALSNRRPEQFTSTYYAISPHSFLTRHNNLHLEQFYLHGQMFDILPAIPDNELPFEIWSAARAERRTESDFCSPDAHWLMRYWLMRERYDEPSLFDYDDGSSEDEWTTVDEDEEDLEDGVDDSEEEEEEDLDGEDN